MSFQNVLKYAVLQRGFPIFTVRGSDDRIFFNIVAVFSLSVDTITHEPLHLA